MASAPEPDVRPVRPAAAASSDVPAIAWPLVERRRPRNPTRSGPERRNADGGHAGTARLSQSAAPPLAPFRWVAIGVGLVVAWPDFGTTSFRLLFGAIVLIVYAAYRTWRPIPYTDDRSTAPALLFEFALATAVVLLTGAWSSPFTFSLLPAAMLAGFSRGSVFAARLTVVCAVIVSAQHLLIDATSVSDGVRDCAAWLAVTSFVAVTSGVARQVSRESARQQSLALDRLGRLAEANALLFSLHRVAQTLPASLDLDEVLDSSITRLRDLVEFDSVTVLLYEESDGSWVPVRRKGNRDQPTLDAETLPVALQQALLARGTVHEPDLTKSGGPGLAPRAASGLYCSLRSRGAQIGLIAVESDVPNRYGAKDLELLNGLVEPLGVAIDNARWFSRLRSIGADEERSRIARDLHDQIGQSLAYLGFELDRAVRVTKRSKFQPVLIDLRDQVRTVVKEVRETLYDLRTDVSDVQDVGTTMQVFCDRVKDRSGLDIKVDRHETGRLPLLQERELWRIAKEAVMNAERHAKASTLTITWQCDGKHAELTVADDGIGFDRRRGRDDSYGMVGMRERATTIGATLEIRSARGAGTTVRVVLDPQDTPDGGRP
jgi:signal transduction histidine kinase